MEADEHVDGSWCESLEIIPQIHKCPLFVELTLSSKIKREKNKTIHCWEGKLYWTFHLIEMYEHEREKTEYSMKGTAREMTPPLCLHTSSSSSTKSKADTSSPQTCAFNVVQKGRCNIVLIFGRCVRTAGINASLSICICVRLSALCVIIVLRRLLHSVSEFWSSFQTVFILFTESVQAKKKTHLPAPGSVFLMVTMVSIIEWQKKEQYLQQTRVNQ